MKVAHRLLLLAALLGASGCAKKAVKVSVTPGQPLPVQAAAVFPFQFRWEEPAHRSYQLSQALVAQAIASNRYAVFGPGEFKLVKAGAANPFVGSDLVLGLADHGLSPLAAIVFKPSAERRAQSEMKQVFDLQGKPKGLERVEQALVLARLEVYHSASRELIAEASGSVEVDPLAERDAADPLPELTALMRTLMAETLAALQDRAPGVPMQRELGFAYRWSGQPALTFAMEGRSALAESMEQMDALEKDLQLDAVVRFFNPDADDATVARLRREPSGLLVTEVLAAGPDGLLPGDLVVEVGGEPALPQSLHRVVRAAAPGAKVPLKVRRSGELRSLALEVR